MLVSNNSYLILGLSSDADEKLLNKRHKEILKLLEIDEVPEYENDISFIDYKSIRNIENIKSAFHELSNQKKKIYHDFLWFQLITKKDERLFKTLCEGDIIESIDGWRSLYKETGKFHYLKNYIIALLLCYENQNKFDDLDFSGDGPEIVRALHECINSEKFWREFFNIVNLSAETSISDIEMNRFKTDMPQYLAEEFFDLAEELKTPKLYIEFNKVFGLSAKELEDNKNVTKPLGIIDKNSKKLKELDLGEDLDEIIDLINEIEEEVKKLKKIGIQKNPRIMKIIDDISMQIRGLAIDLVNNHKDKETAIEFINEAISLSPSETITQKLKKDIKDIEAAEIENKAFDHIFELMKEGKRYWDKENYSMATQVYQKVVNYVKGDLKDKFNLNGEYLKIFKEKVEARINMIYAGMQEYELQNVLGDLENVKNYIRDGGGFQRGNLHIGYLTPQEQIIYFMYIESVQRVAFGEKLQSIRNTYTPSYSYSSGRSNTSSGGNDSSRGCLGWIIGIIIFALITGAFD